MDRSAAVFVRLNSVFICSVFFFFFFLLVHTSCLDECNKYMRVMSVCMSDRLFQLKNEMKLEMQN